MPTIHNDSDQTPIHSSEARVLESEIEELRNRLALLESTIHETVMHQLNAISLATSLRSHRESIEKLMVQEKPLEELLKRRPPAEPSERQEKPIPPQPHKWVPSEEQMAGISHLLSEWLTDESGYDEETWPKLKAALEEDHYSARSLFDE